MTISQLRTALEKYDAIPRQETPVTIGLAILGGSCFLVSIGLAQYGYETAFRWMFVLSFVIFGIGAFPTWHTTVKLQREAGLVCPCCQSHLYPAFQRLHIVDGYCPSSGGRVVEDDPLPLDELWTLRSLSCHTPEQFAARDVKQKKDSLQMLGCGFVMSLCGFVVLYFGTIPPLVTDVGFTKYFWALTGWGIFTLVAFFTAWMTWPQPEPPPHRRQIATPSDESAPQRKEPSGCLWIVKGLLERYGQAIANLTLSIRFWFYLALMILLWRLFH